MNHAVSIITCKAILDNETMKLEGANDAVRTLNSKAKLSKLFCSQDIIHSKTTRVFFSCCLHCQQILQNLFYHV